MNGLLAQVEVWQAWEAVAFWVLSVVGLVAAVAMVTLRDVVHGALMLVLNFFAIAGLFFLLEAPFLGIVQVIVYAGAIMVLFLFVIMLLGVGRDDLLVTRHRAVRAVAWLGAAGLVAAVVFAFAGGFTSPLSVCGEETAAAEDAPQDLAPGTIRCAGYSQAVGEETSSVEFVAERLFSRYTFAFEFVSLLLVVAVVGGMIVGRRREDPAAPGGVPAGSRQPGAAAKSDGATTPASAGPHGHGGAP